MKRNAFTLIELLVVIAIIALLVSILMPSLQKAKEMARDALCMSNLHHIAVAFHMYLSDHDGVFPYAARGTWNSPEGWTNWIARVGIVSKDQHFWDVARRNAVDPILHRGYIEWRRGNDHDGVFKCPTANANLEPKWVGNWDCHYGINYNLLGEREENRPWATTCYNVEDFPADLHMVSDGHLGWYQGGLYFWPGVQLNPNWYAYDAWPLQVVISMSEAPNNYKGHTGQKAIVARINGAVKAEKELTWRDFMVR